MAILTPTTLDALALLGLALGILLMIAGAAGQQRHHNRSEYIDD
jgi:hypothetical protein